MSDQARIVVRQLNGWRWLKASILVTLIALTGCFGARAMHYDIQSYNKSAVASEQEMLLYNIGRLHREQPPHFMMLSSIAQTRIFSATAAFQWGQMWNSLFLWQKTPKNLGTTTKGADAYQASLTAGATENPTIQFVPIQGQDFAQRFESSLTPLFSLFLEDRRWTAPRWEVETIVKLFAQSLLFIHGDAVCKGKVVYTNGSEEFSNCVDELLKSKTNFVQIDGSHRVPTRTSDEPKAADLVTALGAGYEWKKDDDKSAPATPIRIPAWLDYTPEFVAPPEQKKPESSAPVFWLADPPTDPPDWQGLQYTLPKGYQWKDYKFNTKNPASADVYALVPDGYDLHREDNGNLTIVAGNYVLSKVEEPAPHLAFGTRTQGQPDITYTRQITEKDKGSRIVGKGIPDDTTITDVVGNKATMSKPATETSSDTMSIGDVNKFWYVEQVVSYVWPVPQNYFYVELRKGEVGGATAARVCYSQPDPKDPPNTVVCGYLKIGNFLQIMHRLADQACPSRDPEYVQKHCEESIFGIGPKEDIPEWADYSAPYSYTKENGTEQTEWVWVPAHDRASIDPASTDQDRRYLADRDRLAFLTLYKLYQMSLVDTSKLVTGLTPITISK